MKSVACLARGVLGLGIFAAAALANDRLPHQPDAGHSDALTAQALNVRAFEPAVCRAQPASDGELIVQVASRAFSGALILQPYSLRGPHFALLVDDGHGLTQVAPPVEHTYRGYLLGDMSTAVVASVVGDQVSALIFPPDESGEPWFIQPIPASASASATVAPAAVTPESAAVAPAKHALFRASDLVADDWRCGVLDAPLAAEMGGSDAGGDDPTLRGPQCMNICQVAFDADFEYYVQNGSSVANVLSDIQAVLNAVDFIYARDALIQYEITTTIVRTVNPDPYSATDGGAILGEFINYWNANHAAIVRDVAHLMTGRDVDGNVIGVARLTTICELGGAYGFSQSRFTTNMSFRAGLTAHELGHNWSAGHCDGDSDCYIMCSGIGGCSADVRQFGSRSRAAIRSHRDSRTCLAPAGPYAAVMVPRPEPDNAPTLINTPVTIDVLANDFDANCQTLSILSFSATSAGGGSVTRSIGTGPGGRDQLTYSPAAGFSGTDLFTYRCADPGGINVQANVQVQVFALRPADNPARTRPGLDVDYHLLAFDRVPTNFDELTLLEATTLSTLDFPATLGPCAGGSSPELVAAIFTGVINIPTAGDWTFYTESDDGSILYVNGLLVVANDAPHGMRERSGIINLPAGPHSVRIEYYEGGADCGLIARISGPGMIRSVIPAGMWAAPGVNALYYALPQYPRSVTAIDTRPVFRRSSVSTIDVPGLDQWLFDSAERYNIGAVFNGFFDAPAAGLYRFFTESDDGSLLSVGGTSVVMNDFVQGMTERGGYIGLQPGKHAIQVKWYNGGGPGGLIVRVEGPGLPKQVVPVARWSRLLPQDCNANGIDDGDDAETALDLGDMVGGGSGLGGGVGGLGVVQTSGFSVAPGIFAGSTGQNPPSFSSTDGLDGRANLPLVDGVFLPRDLTPIDGIGGAVVFSPSTGTRFDAIRANAGLFDVPLVMADQPAGIPRTGVGMHANAGITFDLDAIRAAHPGRVLKRFEAAVGLTVEVFGAGSTCEAWVLVDGQPRYRRLFNDNTVLFDWVRIDLPPAARRLTIATIDAGNPFADHAAVADARIIVNSDLDADGDGVLDRCACPGDLNGDRAVNESDLGILLQNWQSGPGGDADGDGDTDESDLGILLQNWQRSC